VTDADSITDTNEFFELEEYIAEEYTLLFFAFLFLKIPS
jgi:hypothetical protein